MKRIVIVGISGTGKSVLGRRLAEKTGLTLYHMDSIIWGPDWAEAAESSICAELANIAASENWILEGWIDRYSGDILRKSDIVLYLDYPGWLAAYGGARRWWRYRGVNRPEMPEGCTESFDLRFLWNLLLRKERPHIEAVLSELPLTNLIRARSRQEAEAIFSELVFKINGFQRM